MSKRERLPTYQQKFGKPPAKYDYKHKRCTHASTHEERVDGYTFDVCDVCNIVRKNLGKSKTFPALKTAA